MANCPQFITLFLLDTTSAPCILPEPTIPASLKYIYHLSPHLLSLTPTFSHPRFCTATDEDNRMVVETFGDHQSVLASEGLTTLSFIITSVLDRYLSNSWP